MPDDATERWLPVVGWEDRYEVSDRGRVRSIYTRPDGGPSPGVLRGATHRQGYRTLVLSRNGVSRHHLVHRLVMAAFVGPCPPRQEVNHIDGVKHHNHLSNLEYTSRSRNIQHAYRTGLHRPRTGDAHHQTRYPDALVAEWQRRYAAGADVPDLARESGVERVVVWRLVASRHRRHITTPPG